MLVGYRGPRDTRDRHLARRAADGQMVKRYAAEPNADRRADELETEGDQAGAAIDTAVEETGTLKWFNAEMGYGFIDSRGGEDVFVHVPALERLELMGLGEGQSVPQHFGDTWPFVS